MRAALIATLAVAGLGLTACKPKVEAPFDRGVCYVVVPLSDGTARFNRLADNQPQIEFCAARLEEQRLRFQRSTGQLNDMVGAYQGKFLFVNRNEVSFGDTLDGPRIVALRRTADGQLAIPGAVQRQIDQETEGTASGH